MARYKLDLLGVQKVGWDKRGTVRVGEYIVSMKKETKIINWVQDFCTPHNSIGSKRVEVVSDSLSYIVLRGRWCNIIVLNVHATSEKKSDDSKGSFYEELEQVFDHFHTNIQKFYEEILMQKWGRKYFQTDNSE